MFVMIRGEILVIQTYGGNKLYIDRVLYPVTALGPGNRVVIWTVGCNRKCPGCANPELWERHREQEIEPKKLALYINPMKDKGIDGITITGGEPFDQASEIEQFIEALSFQTEILVFTGYKIEELKEDAERTGLLERIDALIDGEYIREKNDGKSALRGSTNQRIHFINSNIADKYDSYIKDGRKIQNFLYDYKTISVGIHNP